MKEQLLALLAAWVKALAAFPQYLIPLPLIAALVFIAIAGSRIGLRLANIGSLSPGPILAMSGLITLGVCLLWAAVDAIFWAFDLPLLSTRILLWLAPDGLPEDALRELLRLLPGARLLLPAFVAIPIALFAAGILYGLITWAIGRTLAELIALEQKPDDVLARERKGQPEPESTTPLDDNRLGRLYKRFGHWTRTDRVEPRFLRWQTPLLRSLTLLAGVATIAAVTRNLPIPIWVGITVLLSALWRNARKPKPAAAKAPEKADPEKTEKPAGPPVPFFELPELAGRLAQVPALPATEPRPTPAAPAARALLADVLAALDVSTLWAHQAAALDAYHDRRSVLLATAPGSGRKTFTDALVLYALLADAERVLWLCPDRDAARDTAARFEERARATHWTWNILAVDLCSRAGAIDPELSVPSLVFADPEALHRRILASQDRWREFLSTVGLVVVPGIDRYSGVPAAHLAHLFRRFDRAVRRARVSSEGAALLADEPAHRVRVFASSDPGFADIGRYAERIAARSFVIVGPDRDAAPRPRRTARILMPQAASTALHTRDLARRNGFLGELDGFEHAFTADEIARDRPLAAADVVVTQLSGPRYSSLPYLTDHVGAPASTHPVAIVWQPERDPVAEYLATKRPAFDDPRVARGQSLVAQPRSPALERAHLHASITEAEVTLDQLSATFSRELLAGELTALRDQGRLVEHLRPLLDPRAGSVARHRTVRLASHADVHRAVSFRTCAATPFELVERSTGAVVDELDGARAPCAAYPRRILLREGRRYLVLPAAEQDQLERRRIVCEAIADAAITAPIRRLEIRAVERRLRRKAQRAERRTGSLLALGGAGFWLQSRDVAVTEEVHGARTFGLDGTPREEIVDEPPIRCEYATRAALLILPAEPFGEVSAATMHALVHLVRATLPTSLRYEEEDLEIAATQADAGAGPRPALAFVDLHQEGAGFADAITLDLLRPVFLLARDMLATSGEPVLASWTCRAPADQRALDATGVSRVFDALVGAPHGAV